MSCDAIICDWNGTIIENQDERSILESIAVDLFKKSFPWHPLRMVHILKARKELEKYYQEESRDAEIDFVVEMFQVYNEKIINGLAMSFIYCSIERYASRPDTHNKLDYRVLRPIDRCHREGWNTGILSAGYGYGIQRILQSVGYHHCFDFYEANVLRMEGEEAIGFDLNIYRNKPQRMLKLLKDRNMDESRIVYLGNSGDDAGCFELAGYPVVALLASEELKEEYARRYNAFVPHDEADLAQYLQSL